MRYLLGMGLACVLGCSGQTVVGPTMNVADIDASAGGSADGRASTSALDAASDAPRLPLGPNGLPDDSGPITYAEAGSPDFCEPTTCELERAECGSISDGCGRTLKCGFCQDPYDQCGKVTPNKCAKCKPLTCAPAQDCGDFNNGCGGRAVCGPPTCPSPARCGAWGISNTCGNMWLYCSTRKTLVFTTCVQTVTVHTNSAGQPQYCQPDKLDMTRCAQSSTTAVCPDGQTTNIVCELD